MTQIVSIAYIKGKAQRDFRVGRTMADCALAPSSDAFITYRDEFSRLKAEAGHTSPRLHSAAAGRNRIDTQHTNNRG